MAEKLSCLTCLHFCVCSLHVQKARENEIWNIPEKAEDFYKNLAEYCDDRLVDLTVLSKINEMELLKRIFGALAEGKVVVLSMNGRGPDLLGTYRDTEEAKAFTNGDQHAIFIKRN